MNNAGNHKSLLGTSPAFAEVLRNAEVVAITDVPILISGEPGSGKYSFASHIHHCSRRHTQRLIAFDCEAAEPTNLDRLLFGNGEQPGKLKKARDGTLLLARIHALPATVQAKLLGHLRQSVQPVARGTNQTRGTARIIATTGHDLRECVGTGRFDNALYHQLNVIHLEIPPLRQRDGDIPLLIDHFFQQLVQQYRRPPPSLSHSAIRCLDSYHWPGNLRELKNICERLFLINNGCEITTDNLPVDIRRPAAPDNKAGFRLPDTGIDLAALESDLLRQALQCSHGNKSRAARLLGLTRDAFLYRLKKYSIAR